MIRFLLLTSLLFGCDPGAGTGPGPSSPGSMAVYLDFGGQCPETGPMMYSEGPAPTPYTRWYHVECVDGAAVVRADDMQPGAYEFSATADAVNWHGFGLVVYPGSLTEVSAQIAP